MDFRILFLGGAKRVSLGRHLIQTAERLGHTACIFSYELDMEVAIAEIGEVIKGLRWSDENILEDLKSVILRNDINIVLPFVDPAVEIAARLRSEMSGIFIPVSDADLCRQMFDKVVADEVFQKINIAVPENRSSVKQYPRIWKPRRGSASQGIKIAFNETDESGMVESDYLIQEYVRKAEEYTVDCYIGCDGKIKSLVPRRRLEINGGEVTKSITIRDKRITNISEDILNTLDFRGPVTLQFLKSEDDRILLMEINPRFGGGVVTSVAAGSGILEMLLKEATGEIVERKDDWREHTLITRYMQEVVFYN